MGRDLWDMASEEDGQAKSADSSAPSGDDPNPEVVAQMSKFLKAVAAKDPEGMAKAFEGAAAACDDDTN